MTSKLSSFLLAAVLTLIPVSAWAEISLSDMLPADDSLTSFELSPDLDFNLAQPVRHHHTTYYRPAPSHHRVTHVHRTYRPVRPVVVVEQPATVVVENDVEEETVSSRKVGSTFGLGLRGNVLTTSDIHLESGSQLHSKVSGGIGWYVKLRPIRWISVEFINDYSFGKFDNVGTTYDEYFRVPIVIGLRGHVFDYGSLDVYGVAAASCTFVTLDDGDNHVDREIRFPQFGAQFGGGISLVAGGFEIGIDARYTLEEAPDDSFFGKVDQDDVIHGFLFSVNMGFAI
ncbi:MAG: hypothetical protein IKY83_12940 [Proteobacteria bacterium]|nr:hypothetical protein [Pseudomonadota bacterium]